MSSEKFQSLSTAGPPLPSVKLPLTKGQAMIVGSIFAPEIFDLGCKNRYDADLCERVCNKFSEWGRLYPNCVLRCSCIYGEPSDQHFWAAGCNFDNTCEKPFNLAEFENWFTDVEVPDRVKDGYWMVIRADYKNFETAWCFYVRWDGICESCRENYHANELNGNNGEATNTDDLKRKTNSASPVDFALHGKYVGPGHTGGSKLGESNFATLPVDELDNAARNHDYLYTITNSNDRRALSDYKLANDAFKASKKAKGLTKLKAGVVGAGMAVKGYLTGNAMNALDRRFELNPPIGMNLSSDTEKVKQKLKPAPAYKPNELNGNNGEATNTDDLKGVIRLKKAEKKIEKKVEKKIQKQVRKKPMNGGGAIKNELMPTQYQNTYDIKPYYRTVKSSGNTRRIATLFSLGYVGGTGPTSGSVYQSGGVIYSAILDKSLFTGQNIGTDFDLYERWKLRSARYHFLPNVGSTTAGTVWAMPDPDAIDIIPLGVCVPPQTIVGHRFSRKHTLWAGKFSGNMVFNRSRLFTDAENVAFSTINNSFMSTSNENRLYAAGVFTLMNGDGILATQTTSFGELFIEVIIDFSETQSSDSSKLVCSAKFASTTGHVLNTLTSAVNDDTAGSLIHNNSWTNIVAEFTYNPLFSFMVGGGNTYFMLPVGNYIFSLTEGTTGGPTVTAVSPSVTVSNAVYSSSLASFFDAVGPFGPEFSNGQASGIATATGEISTTGFIRITQVTAGNKAKVQVYPVLTYTGTANIVSLHLAIFRLPDFGNMPLAAVFPVGNDSNSSQFGEGDDIRLQELLQKKKKFLQDQLEDKLKKFNELEQKKEDDKQFENERWLQFAKYTLDKHILKAHDDMKMSLDCVECKRLLSDVKGLEEDSKTSEVIDRPYAKVSAGNDNTFAISEPESPEVVENPLTKSIHLNKAAATTLLTSLSSVIRRQ